MDFLQETQSTSKTNNSSRTNFNEESNIWFMQLNQKLLQQSQSVRRSKVRQQENNVMINVSYSYMILIMTHFGKSYLYNKLYKCNRKIFAFYFTESRKLSQINEAYSPVSSNFWNIFDD